MEQNVANDKAVALVTAVKQLLCGAGEMGETKGKTFFNFVRHPAAHLSTPPAFKVIPTVPCCSRAPAAT